MYVCMYVCMYVFSWYIFFNYTKNYICIPHYTTVTSVELSFICKLSPFS